MKVSKKIVNSPLLYVMIICAIVQMFWISGTPEYVEYPDTITYLQYSDNIFKGEISGGRTPIYPAFLSMMNTLLGPDIFLNGVAIAQYIMIYLSIIIIYLTAKEITNKKWLSVATALIYGISPFIILWGGAILTEALAIVGMEILTYITIKYLKKPSNYLAILIGICNFILVMLRPSFIFVLAIYVVFWIIRLFTNREEKKCNISGIASLAIVILLILIYSLCVKINTGFFTITTTSNTNKIVATLYSGAYQNAENKEIVEYLNTNYPEGLEEGQSWIAISELRNKYTEKELLEFANNAQKSNLIKYGKYLARKVVETSTLPIGTSYVEEENGNKSIIYQYHTWGYLLMPISFIHVYLIVALALIYMIYILIKERRVEYMLAFFTTVTGCALFTIIIGAPFEVIRLFVPFVSVVLLFITYVISEIINKYLQIKKGGE